MNNQVAIRRLATGVPGRDVEAMLRNADTAMYHAKRKGRNNLRTGGGRACVFTGARSPRR